jgi:Fe-S cluster biosynthesis and repair protein YggX
MEVPSRARAERRGAGYNDGRANASKKGTVMARMVNCVKLGRELPGLEKPPYPGELGQRIYDNVSAQAWDLWMRQAVLIINHYGLSMVDPQAQELLMQQAEQFFFGEGARMPEGWSPEGQGGQAGKGGARRKK